MSRLPEIFIVGTMKGGTTILFDYVCTHPRILRPKNKETHFFTLYFSNGLDWYLSQFPDRKETELSLDASPTYFDVAAVPVIPALIRSVVPDARIVLIVRDPISRAISHFEHLRLVANPALFMEIDINEFFSRPLEGCFIRGNPLDESLKDVILFSLYYHKYLNYRNIFGNQLLVLTNKGLRTDPVATMKRVFSHLGVEWVSSPLFGQEKYLSGSTKISLDPAVRAKLAALLYPDYRKFCDAANLEFEEL